MMMRFLESRQIEIIDKISLAFLFATRELLQSRFRVLLTVIGVSIGIASVSSMLLIGYSLEAKIKESLQSLGADVLTINASTGKNILQQVDNSSLQGKNFNISYPVSNATSLQLMTLLSSMPEVAGVTSIAQIANCPNSQNLPDVEMYHIDESTPILLNLKSEKGLIFNRMLNARPLIMVGAQAFLTLKETFPYITNGSIIEICGQPLEVATILEYHKGAEILQGIRLNNSILLNTTAMLRIVAQRPPQLILARLNPTATSEEFGEKLVNRIKFIMPDINLYVAGAWQISQMKHEQTKLYTNFLIVIGAISLLVGSLGVANVMLASITRRQREIGLRMALGAAASDIIIQFMTESALICLVGAMIGLLIGVAISAIALTLSGIGFYISYWVIIQSAVIAIVCGLLAGFYPARKAANLDPILSLQGAS